MRFSMAALFAFLIAAMPASGVPAASTGNLQLCNNFPHPVLFALGWSENHIAYTRGWWTVNPNHCFNVPLRVNTFYWSARSTKYRAANGDTEYTIWGDKRHRFCTSDNGFYFDHADGPCGKYPRSGFTASFTRTDGIPVYETVTIGQSGSSSQSIAAGHTQTLTAP